MSLIPLEKLPSSWSRAIWKVLSVLAFIRSITASAWLRSSLPFRKALLVNSPGSASLAPLEMTRERIFLRETMDPWHWISTTSSAV